VERSWLETIQSLGLDVQLAIVLLLFALDGLGMLVRRVAARLAARPRRVRAHRVPGQQPADAEAWPTESWQASRGPAG